MLNSQLHGHQKGMASKGFLDLSNGDGKHMETKGLKNQEPSIHAGLRAVMVTTELGDQMERPLVAKSPAPIGAVTKGDRLVLASICEHFGNKVGGR